MRRRLRAKIAAVAMSLFMLPFSGVQAQEKNIPQSQALKTAIVFKLLRFVSWPEPAMANSKTVNVCLPRKEPFYSAFKEIEGAAIGERTLYILLLTRLVEQQCHAVFASSKARLTPRDWLPLAKPAVLTISDSKNFAQRGGMINLVMRDKRVSFSVNVKAVEDANLQISALVLKLAEIVEHDTELTQIHEASGVDS